MITRPEQSLTDADIARFEAEQPPPATLTDADVARFDEATHKTLTDADVRALEADQGAPELPNSEPLRTLTDAEVAAATNTFHESQLDPDRLDILPSLDQASAGAANVFRGVGRGLVGLGDMALATGSFAARMGEAAAGSEDKSLVRESIDSGRKWLDSKTAPALASRDADGRVNTNGEFIDNLGGELASTITQIWAGSKIPTPWAAKPGAGVLARLRPSALTILFGGRQAEETANKAEKAGRGQKAQLGLGLATGTWEMAVESLSQIYGAQAAANPAVGNAVARAIRGRVLNILGEGAEEALQAGGEGAMEKLAGIDDRSWSEIGKQAAIEAGMALLSTGLIEGGNVAGAFSARRSAEFANREQDRADLSASVGAAEFAASDVTAPAPQQEGGPHETELPSEIAQRTDQPQSDIETAAARQTPDSETRDSQQNAGERAPGVSEQMNEGPSPTGVPNQKTPSVPAPTPHTVYAQSSGGADASATRAPSPNETRGAIGMDLRDAVDEFRELSGKMPKIKEHLRARNALGLFRSRAGGTAQSTDIELLASLFGLYDHTDADKIRTHLAKTGLKGAELDAQVDREIRALVALRRNEPQKRPVKVLLHELAHLADFLPEGNLKRGNILGHVAAMQTAYRKHFLAAEPGSDAPHTAAEVKALDEQARKRLIERKAIQAEARTFIPWWRGVSEYENYFDKPAEMYAELFGAFLADPDAVKDHAPQTFRAFAGWMSARPAVQKMYNEFQAEKHTGQRNTRHVANLRGEWERQAQDDLRRVTDALKKPSRMEKVMALRYGLDRRLGPYETAINRAYKALMESAVSDQDRARLKTIYDRAMGMKKEYLHVRNVVREFDIRVFDSVDQPLRDADLDWMDLAEYKFHRRVAWELDGKAAPRGWAPDTSLKRLEEMRHDLGEERWGVLERASVEFRAAFEQTVIQNPYVKKMLGADMIALMEKNVEYVTFEHVPLREQVEAYRAKLKAGDKKGAKAMLEEEGLDWLSEQMEGRFGDSVSPHIYRFKGSFDPVRDPLTATMRKAEAIIKSAYMNELKIMLRDMEADAGFEAIQPVKTVRDPRTGQQRPSMVDNARWKTVLYMEHGELKGYRASKWLAKALDPASAELPEFVRSMMFLNRFIANLYTTMNIAFMEPAYERDKQSATENVKGLKRAPLVQYVPVAGKLLGMVTRYIPESYSRSLPRWLLNDSHIEWYEAQARRAAKLIASGNFATALAEADQMDAEGRTREAQLRRTDVALARAGLTQGVLMPSIEAIQEMYGVSDADLIWHRSGIRKADYDEGASVGAAVLGFFRGMGERLGDMNEIRENTTKLATLSFLMNKQGVTEDQARLIVTDFGGSPDFSERGAYASYIEFVFQPFLNARKEAAVRNVRAFKDHPGDFLAKKSAYVIGPAAMRWLLYSGAAVAMYRHWVPDEEEREKSAMWQFLKWCASNGANISDYLLKSYIVTPLPINTGNPECSVVLCMPMDQTDQVVSTLVWNSLDAAAGSMGLETSRVSDPFLQSIQSIGAEFLPSIESQAPFISSLRMIGNFLQGNNYFDAFRQRNVFTEDELRQRFKDRDGFMKLAGELWNRGGGAMFWRYQSNNGLPRSETDIPLADFMRLPLVQSSLGRYIRIVHNGRAQAIARISEDEQNIKAGTRLEVRRLFSDYIKEGYNWTPEIQRAITSNPYAAEYWQNMNQRYHRELHRNPAIEGWRNSPFPEIRTRYENMIKRLSEVDN